MKRPNEAAGVVEWDAFIEELCKIFAQGNAGFAPNELQSRKRIIQSDAFRRAFEGLPDTPLEDALRWAVDLVGCITLISLATQYCERPRDLLESIEDTRGGLNAAIKDLQKASDTMLQIGVWRPIADPADKYWAEIAGMVARIRAEPIPQTVAQLIGSFFNPENLKRKGKAATDPRLAFNGWMIRELARYIPEAAPKRAAAVAELLAFADIIVDATSAATIIRRR